MRIVRDRPQHPAAGHDIWYGEDELDAAVADGGDDPGAFELDRIVPLRDQVGIHSVPRARQFLAAT